MASASELSRALLDELRIAIAESGVTRFDEPGAADSFVPPAKIPPDWAPFVGRALPSRPLAVAVDVYGTLLASAAGEIGPGAAWTEAEESSGEADQPAGVDWLALFPHDMADRLSALVAADHELQRANGIPWPEVDAASIFARALDLDLDDGARACVAWECTTNACSAMQGAAEFLSTCALGGLPLSIVSNAQFYTPLFLEEAFGARLYGGLRAGDRASSSPLALGFDPELTLWSCETGRAKPDRWMFDELARRLAGRGIPAGRILYVGNDALNDCAAAGEAGLMTALFCGDERSCRFRAGDPRVSAHPPTTLALSWDDLRRIVCT